MSEVRGQRSDKPHRFEMGIRRKHQFDRLLPRISDVDLLTLLFLGRNELVVMQDKRRRTDRRVREALKHIDSVYMEVAHRQGDAPLRLVQKTPLRRRRA
jgi:hypothetical protein